MKKIIIAILAFAVLATGVLFAIAQTANGDKNGGWGRRGGHHRGGMMLRGLDLTEDQKAQMKQIREASKAKTQPLREALKANRQKLHELAAAGSFDEAAVTALANEQAGLSAQLIVERARVHSQTAALLTAEQKAKVAEMKDKMKERFKNRKEGRKGGEKPQAGTEE